MLWACPKKTRVGRKIEMGELREQSDQVLNPAVYRISVELVLALPVEVNVLNPAIGAAFGWVTEFDHRAAKIIHVYGPNGDRPMLGAGILGEAQAAQQRHERNKRQKKNKTLPNQTKSLPHIEPHIQLSEILTATLRSHLKISMELTDL